VDGGCEPKNPGGVATCGWVIYDPSNKILAEEARVVQDGGPLATNNYAEYCGLGFALKWLREQEWRGELNVQADSQLLVNQVTEKWQCKAKHLIPLRNKIWEHLEALNLSFSATVGQTFTCTSCKHRGDIDTLIDMGDDLMCPMCHTIAIVFDGSPDTDGKQPCSIIWVRREFNAYADELTNMAYRLHMQKKNKK
jgi:ribonuclease HI